MEDVFVTLVGGVHDGGEGGRVGRVGIDGGDVCGRGGGEIEEVCETGEVAGFGGVVDRLESRVVWEVGVGVVLEEESEEGCVAGLAGFVEEGLAGWVRDVGVGAGIEEEGCAWEGG